MYTQEKNTVVKTRTAVIVASFIIAILFIAFAAVIYFSDKEDLTEDGIRANLESLTEDKGYEYACSYITEIGIKSFDKIKFINIETYYQHLYVGNLPSTLELAKGTVSLYLEYFYNDLINSNDTNKITDALINCYVASTGDRYGYYRNETENTEYDESTSGEYVGIGVTVLTDPDENGNIVIISTSKNSPAEEAGILPGDVIVSVDGKAVSEIGSEAAASLIKGPSGTTVLIGIKRGEELLSLTVERRIVAEQSVSYSVIDGNVGLVSISGFKSNTPDQFREAIDALEEADVKAIVFDVRNNPGGLLTSIINVLEYLVPTGTRIMSYSTLDGRELVEYAEDDAENSDHVIKVPLAVLCNKHTASAAELFTAALRDYDSMGILDVITVGERTFSKGVMQATYTLSDKTSITLTIAFYNPPSGVNYDGVGVIPDYEAPTDVEFAELPGYAADLIFTPNSAENAA